jgi:tetratricopeptide (TPR) repeat protein
MAAPIDERAKERAEAYYVRATDALAKSNFDYAIQMYLDACKIVPDHLPYRQALRLTQRRKYGNEPEKVGKLVGMRIQPIRLRIKTEKAQGHWAKVLELCEEAFGHNPWDIATARDSAEAATHLGFHELAAWTLETVFPQAQTDVEFLRQLAYAYEELHQWSKAILCWERVAKQVPADDVARRKLKDLAANAVITHGEYAERSATPSEPVVETKPIDVPETGRAWKAQDPEQRYLKAIAEQPEQERNYIDLAEHYKAHQRLDDAEKILAQGVKTIPSSGYLKSAHADVQIARLQRAVESWTRKVQQHPGDAEAKAKLEQLHKMLAEYEVKEYKRRVERSPEDAGLRIELGTRLARQGKHDEAIAEFQQARTAPAHRISALVHAASSFEAKNLPKLAERNLQDALKAVEPEDLESLKTIHYKLARLAESQDQLELAEEHYNEVAAIDYTYQDVPARLQAVTQKRAERGK